MYVEESIVFTVYKDAFVEESVTVSGLDKDEFNAMVAYVTVMATAKRPVRGTRFIRAMTQLSLRESKFIYDAIKHDLEI